MLLDEHTNKNHQPNQNRQYPLIKQQTSKKMAEGQIESTECQRIQNNRFKPKSKPWKSINKGLYDFELEVSEKSLTLLSRA